MKMDLHRPKGFERDPADVDLPHQRRFRSAWWLAGALAFAALVYGFSYLNSFVIVAIVVTVGLLLALLIALAAWSLDNTSL